MKQNFHKLLIIFIITFLCFTQTNSLTNPKICIIGSGIAGSSLSYFLKNYTCTTNKQKCIENIHIFERNTVPGGRMRTVTVGEDTFEAGGSIIHPKNLHALRFAKLLNLSVNSNSDDDSWFGIWDGNTFVFKGLKPADGESSYFYRKLYGWLNDLRIFWRYGFSLFRMDGFVQKMLDRFMLYYKEEESRPVFETVDEMLKWSGLYELTHRTLDAELKDAGLSSLLISELVTVITRINYGQSVSISGLAGAVSLAGSDPGLWSVKGGNWQLASGLINHTNAELHLNEEINSVSYVKNQYLLKSSNGNSHECDVAVIATPLDELNISISPSFSFPNRRMHHTFTTFVRGLLNLEYFGFNHASDIPNLIGTIETPDIPFSCISILKKYSNEDMTYKMFSRSPANESLLDQLFSIRKETIHIDWPAYPHYNAPEVFAPIILDGMHLYYINSFENAASTIETSAVAAENVARLIISRLSKIKSSVPTVKIPASEDGVSKIFGQEHGGRVRRLGFGVVPSQMRIYRGNLVEVHALRNQVSGLEAKLQELTAIMLDMKEKQTGNEENPETPHANTPQSHRESNNLTINEQPNRNARQTQHESRKCKLLSWEKQVVAEGTVASNPNCLVYFKKLGSDGCKVWVDVAVDPGAFLWRPNSEMCTIGEAVGSTVAWHKDFLAFD